MFIANHLYFITIDIKAKGLSLFLEEGILMQAVHI